MKLTHLKHIKCHILSKFKADRNIVFDQQGTPNNT